MNFRDIKKLVGNWQRQVRRGRSLTYVLLDIPHGLVWLRREELLVSLLEVAASCVRQHWRLVGVALLLHRELHHITIEVQRAEQALGIILHLFLQF